MDRLYLVAGTVKGSPHAFGLDNASQPVLRAIKESNRNNPGFTSLISSSLLHLVNLLKPEDSSRSCTFFMRLHNLHRLRLGGAYSLPTYNNTSVSQSNELGI